MDSSKCRLIHSGISKTNNCLGMKDGEGQEGRHKMQRNLWGKGFIHCLDYGDGVHNQSALTNCIH